MSAWTRKLLRKDVALPKCEQPLPNNTNKTLLIYGSVHFHHSKIAMQLDSRIVNSEIMDVNMFNFTSLFRKSKHAAHRGKGMCTIEKYIHNMFCLASLESMTCHSQTGYFMEKTKLSKPKTRHLGKKRKSQRSCIILNTYVYKSYICMFQVRQPPSTPTQWNVTISSP